MTDQNEDEQTGGLLTPPQRAYLRGEAEIDPDSTHERVTRSRIRDRIHAGLSTDFALLSESLREDDREQVLEEFSIDVTHSLIEMVAWIHQAAEKTGLDSEQILEEGIERGETRMGNEDITVEVDIELQSGVEWLQERFEAGDPTLSGAELARLQRETSIDSDAIGAYYGKALEEESDSAMVATNTFDKMNQHNDPEEDGSQ